MRQVRITAGRTALLYAILRNTKGITLIDIKANEYDETIEMILEADFFPSHKPGEDMPEWTVWLSPKRQLAPVGRTDWRETNDGWVLSEKEER